MALLVCVEKWMFMVVGFVSSRLLQQGRIQSVLTDKPLTMKREREREEVSRIRGEQRDQ